MLIDKNEQLTSVAIIGGGINACLMALLIKERLNGVVGDVQLVLNDIADSEFGLISLSAGARWLHKLLGIDEKILLRRGIANYLYGSKLVVAPVPEMQVGGEEFFLSREIANIPHLAGPWFELIHHARNRNHNVGLDSLSLSALASRDARFLDPEVIKGPYSNLSVNLLIDVRAYKQYLLERLSLPQVNRIAYESAQICYQANQVFISLGSDQKVEADLVIDFSSRGDRVNLPDNIKQYKNRIASGNLDSYLWSSCNDQAGGLANPMFESFTTNACVYSKMESGRFRQNLCLGDRNVVEKYAQSCHLGNEGASARRHLDIPLHAPFWLDNYVCFPAADYTPWDPCWSMWDLVREGMIDLIGYWPDREHMSGFADEFNRVSYLVARDHFELAAVFCEARALGHYFSSEMQVLARTKIELYATYGVIRDSESQAFSAEYWAKVMMGCGIYAEKPAGFYSDASIADFMKCVDWYHEEISTAALRMPKYNEYLNYLLR